MMMKIWIRWIAVALLGAMFFGPAIAEDGEKEKEEDKGVVIWISSQQDKDYYEKMVTTYAEEIDEDFKATVVPYGFQELPEKLGIALKAGAGLPDIVQLDEAFFGGFLRGDVPFVDVADRMEKADMKKDFVPNRLKLFSQGEKIYGVPQSLSAIVLYYRTDLFEEYEIKEEDLATWDKAAKLGRELADEHAVGLMSMDASYFEMLLRQKGSNLFGDDGKPLPDFETAVELMEWMVGLYKDGVAVLPERGSIFDPLFFSSQVENDEVLTIMGADWFGLDLMPQFAPALEGKWGVMPLPAWKEGGPRTSCFAGQGLLIPKGSEKIDESWKFIEWVMTDTEANVSRYEMGNSFPAYTPVWKDERMLKSSKYFTGTPMGKVLTEIGKDVPEVKMNPKRPLAFFLMQDSYFSTAIYEVQKPEEVLKQFRGQLSE